MADIIQLLPDAIANQIAAGEVIQRPASVVKELMENAIDAGSTNIKLIIKEAGKTLIQVIDNGCGMSETDARMAFERHATSKIREASDLFAIRTMGFRGEALASMAAISHLEMKTRKQSDELGIRIYIEGSEVKAQESVQCAAGTGFAVKNLFYNVPARRKFLKSDAVEMRHILDEFQRIALANPDVFFSLHHNNSELFHLAPANLRQRIIGLFGQQFNKRLVPINEPTDLVNIHGFVGKPEFARKTRGEQLFFVNQRFIKSPYLHHSIMGAYEGVLADGTYPLYVIFFDIDPEKIDINVHPTKQEIKFDDEREIYNYLKVAVRHALGQFNVTPSLDFDSDTNFANRQPNIPSSKQAEFKTDTFRDPSRPISSSGGDSYSPPKPAKQEWEKLYDGLDDLIPEEQSEPEDVPFTIESSMGEEQTGSESKSFSEVQKLPFQVHNSYILSHIKSGYLLIDQQLAHERILYEQYLEALEKQNALSQKQLFPNTLNLPPGDAAILKTIMPDLNLLGFDIQEFGKNTFVVNGIPAEMVGKQNEKAAIEFLLEQFKINVELKLDAKENIARSMARSTAVKKGQKLSIQEMQVLIDQLFACEIPFKSPTGRNCFISFELDELKKRFE
jgi:DNA mismatch repair protein MutL